MKREKVFYFEPMRSPIGFEIPEPKAEETKLTHDRSELLCSPGPWTVTAGIVKDSNGRLIIEDCLGNPVCATSLRGVQGRTRLMEANASLIAAAPDLLDSLEELYSYLCVSDRDGESTIPEGAGERARMAIARARGEVSK